MLRGAKAAVAVLVTSALVGWPGGQAARVSAESAASVPSPAVVGEENAGAPPWRPGDEWVFRWKSPAGHGIYLWAVDRVEPVNGVAHYVLTSGTREIYYRTNDLAHSLEKVAGAVQFQTTPSRLLYRWPMTVGASWEQSFVFDNVDGGVQEQRMVTWRIDREETIVVPAGSFRAFKLVAHSQPSGTLLEERWYAPEARQLVRMREYLSYGVRVRELLRFTLR